MVSLERQKAAKRAEIAARLQYLVALPPLIIATFAGLNALTATQSQELINGGIKMLEFLIPSIPLIWRGSSNEIRKEEMLDETIADDDPRLPSLRRNYFKEAVAVAKAIAEVPGRVVNRLRRTK